MAQRRRKRNYRLLAVLVLVTGIFLLLLGNYHPLTTSSKLDGVVAVLLGLYTCSQPAANFLDLLLYYRSSINQTTSIKSLLIWLAANLIVVFFGYLAIVNGMIRFAER